MAMEKETEKTVSPEKETETKLSKEEAKKAKAEAKKKKAQTKKDEINKQIDELKTKISEENDDKEKAKLRKQRDELIEQRDAFVITDEKVTIPMSKNAKTCIKSCVAVVLIVALLVTYVATGWARHGFISTLGWPQKTFTGLVLTDADGEKHSIKVSTYNYYFANYYNQQQQQQQYMSQLQGLSTESSSGPDFEKAFKEQTYTDDDGKKMTWAEHAEDEVIDNIKSVYTYYYAAVKKNKGKEPEIKDSQKDELKDTLKEYKTEAKKYGFTLSAYLEAALGHGVDEKTFRKEAKIAYISQNYKEDYQDELAAKAYKDADYQKYLKEHRDELVSVDVKYFECSSEDDAKAMAKALKADGSNFASLASKYSENDYEKAANKNPVETTYKGMTRSTLQGIGAAIGTADEHKEEKGEEEEHVDTYSGLDWLYSKDRKAGDKKAYSTSVVYVTKPVYLSNTKTVNVRHILLKLRDESTESEEDNENADVSAADATDAQWKAAKKRADDVLAKYNSAQKTEDAFAAFAKEYSDDSNADDGGLYENIVPNQMVPSFNAWCFDSNRKAGDVEIVKTEFGYHIIYFVGQGEMEAWKYTAQQALASEDGEKTVDKFEKSIKIKKSWPGSCYFETDTDISN